MPPCKWLGPLFVARVYSAPLSSESSLGDAVGEAADGCAEVGRIAEVIGQRVERERDIGQAAVAIRRFDGGDRGPVRHELDAKPLGVGQGVQIDCLAVGRLSKQFLLNAHDVPLVEVSGGRLLGAGLRLENYFAACLRVGVVRIEFENLVEIGDARSKSFSL